eukprot:Hpha_TRINITY_DN15421_c0_g1::TRINITY_DN15421_c0_g1_i6::g.174775::m.174775
MMTPRPAAPLLALAAVSLLLERSAAQPVTASAVGELVLAEAGITIKDGIVNIEVGSDVWELNCSYSDGQPPENATEDEEYESGTRDGIAYFECGLKFGKNGLDLYSVLPALGNLGILPTEVAEFKPPAFAAAHMPKKMNLEFLFLRINMQATVLQARVHMAFDDWNLVPHLSLGPTTLKLLYDRGEQTCKNITNITATPTLLPEVVTITRIKTITRIQTFPLTVTVTVPKKPSTVTLTLPVPTSSPTTSSPTKAPTAAPSTTAPTLFPTAPAATSYPSVAPTEFPTLDPTTGPATSSPTRSPTKKPKKSCPVPKNRILNGNGGCPAMFQDCERCNGCVWNTAGRPHQCTCMAPHKPCWKFGHLPARRADAMADDWEEPTEDEDESEDRSAFALASPTSAPSTSAPTTNFTAELVPQNCSRDWLLQADIELTLRIVQAEVVLLGRINNYGLILAVKPPLDVLNFVDGLGVLPRFLRDYNDSFSVNLTELSLIYDAVEEKITQLTFGMMINSTIVLPGDVIWDMDISFWTKWSPYLQNPDEEIDKAGVPDLGGFQGDFYFSISISIPKSDFGEEFNLTMSVTLAVPFEGLTLDLEFDPLRLPGISKLVSLMDLPNITWSGFQFIYDKNMTLTEFTGGLCVEEWIIISGVNITDMCCDVLLKPQGNWSDQELSCGGLLGLGSVPFEVNLGLQDGGWHFSVTQVPTNSSSNDTGDDWGVASDMLRTIQHLGVRRTADRVTTFAAGFEFGGLDLGFAEMTGAAVDVIYERHLDVCDNKLDLEVNVSVTFPVFDDSTLYGELVWQDYREERAGRISAGGANWSLIPDFLFIEEFAVSVEMVDPVERVCSPPTAAPSVTPTVSPTGGQPTKAPTLSPTNPTKAPVGPSRSPTRPTKSPTEAPTTSPTSRGPTKSPVKPPSRAPSARSPTKSPIKPTTAPSRSPSARSPTKSPIKPTKAPTTSSPSRSPTTSPTSRGPTTSPVQPTRAPSRTPTSRGPTTSPLTSSPSKSPTTSSPSKSPLTSSPSKSPTKSPGVPTRSPTTSSPTRPPTKPPISPTQHPNKPPTKSPGVPSVSPTRGPTSSPSLNSNICRGYPTSLHVGSLAGCQCPTKVAYVASLIDTQGGTCERAFLSVDGLSDSCYCLCKRRIQWRDAVWNGIKCSGGVNGGWDCRDPYARYCSKFLTGGGTPAPPAPRSTNVCVGQPDTIINAPECSCPSKVNYVAAIIDSRYASGDQKHSCEGALTSYSTDCYCKCKRTSQWTGASWRENANTVLYTCRGGANIPGWDCAGALAQRGCSDAITLAPAVPPPPPSNNVCDGSPTTLLTSTKCACPSKVQLQSRLIETGGDTCEGLAKLRVLSHSCYCECKRVAAWRDAVWNGNKCKGGINGGWDCSGKARGCPGAEVHVPVPVPISSSVCDGKPTTIIASTGCACPSRVQLQTRLIETQGKSCEGLAKLRVLSDSCYCECKRVAAWRDAVWNGYKCMGGVNSPGWDCEGTEDSRGCPGGVLAPVPAPVNENVCAGWPTTLITSTGCACPNKVQLQTRLIETQGATCEDLAKLRVLSDSCYCECKRVAAWRDAVWNGHKCKGGYNSPGWDCTGEPRARGCDGETSAPAPAFVSGNVCEADPTTLLASTTCSCPTKVQLQARLIDTEGESCEGLAQLRVLSDSCYCECKRVAAWRDAVWNGYKCMGGVNTPGWDCRGTRGARGCSGTLAPAPAFESGNVCMGQPDYTLLASTTCSCPTK